MFIVVEYNFNVEVKQLVCDKICFMFFCDVEWCSYLYVILLLLILQSCNFQMFFWVYNLQCCVI